MSTPNEFTTREFTDSSTQQTPRRSRRIWWILGGVALILVAVLVPGAIMMASGTDPADRVADPKVAAPGDSPEFGELRWEQVGRTQLPFSSTAGPAQLDGVTARGFAHTRAGAILAAWQIPIRLAVIGDGTDGIYSSQVIGTDAEIAELRSGMDSLQRSYATDQALPRVIAWRPHRPYSDDVASYDFALPGEADTEVRLVRFSVVWLKGDWRYQPGLFGSATGGPVDARSVNPDNGWTRFPAGVQ